ncbi:MAG: GtrA family protein [Eubacteriaceae bacterium]|jgi:glycosyltransferase involved in cell wall biosynthesis
MITQKITALIPACEPTDVLPELARQLVCLGISVVVVDDGSGPSCSDVFNRTRQFADVISYPDNRGKGYALKAGLEYIDRSCQKRKGADVVVTLDADGQHTAADAVKTAIAAVENPGSLTLGVRRFDKNTPWRSRFGNRLTSLVYLLSSGSRVSDTQTGLRAFGSDLIPFLLGIEGERYEYEMNVLMECSRHHIPIREIPIQTIYIDGNSSSHFRKIRDSFLIYGKILKFAASSLIGFTVDFCLYSLFTVLLSGIGSAVSIIVANIIARIVSAGTNFAMNKRYVFKNHDSVIQTGLRYFILAGFILAGNTLMLSLLADVLDMNKYAAKIVTEMIFFLFSWFVQNKLIFNRNSGRQTALPVSDHSKKNQDDPADYSWIYADCTSIMLRRPTESEEKQ